MNFHTISGSHDRKSKQMRLSDGTSSLLPNFESIGPLVSWDDLLGYDVELTNKKTTYVCTTLSWPMRRRLTWVRRWVDQWEDDLRGYDVELTNGSVLPYSMWQRQHVAAVNLAEQHVTAREVEHLERVEILQRIGARQQAALDHRLDSIGYHHPITLLQFIQTSASFHHLFLCPALAEHTVFIVSVRNGSRRVRSQRKSVVWGTMGPALLAGHTTVSWCCHFTVFYLTNKFCELLFSA